MPTSSLKIAATDLQDPACHRLNQRFQNDEQQIASLQDAIAGLVTPEAFSAQATGNLTLTTSAQAVPGAGVMPAKPGIYLVIGNFEFQEAGAGDVGATLVGLLRVGSISQKAQTTFIGQTAGARGMGTQCWVVSLSTPNQSLSLWALKLAGTGTSSVQTNTTITAIRLSAG